jgi:hypothetical protein
MPKVESALQHSTFTDHWISKPAQMTDHPWPLRAAASERT